MNRIVRCRKKEMGIKNGKGGVSVVRKRAMVWF
jgi:hypothetical protein